MATERDRAAIDLWWAPLDVPSAAAETFAASLSPDEQERAARFHHPRDGARFVAGRGALRRLLAGQLGCAPRDVPIVVDADGGKPRVADSELRFSASRSADVALYATSWTMDVGVDVEAVRASADVDLDRLAARFFTPAERRALASLPPAQRLAAAFDCWTRKEAYGKGTGAGLGFALRAVDVWAGDRRPVTVGGWAVRQVAVAPPGFAAAVAGASLGEGVLKAPLKLG